MNLSRIREVKVRFEDGLPQKATVRYEVEDDEGKTYRAPIEEIGLSKLPELLGTRDGITKHIAERNGLDISSKIREKMEGLSDGS